MNANARRYMAWAKLHSRTTYELTNSGVPVADPAEFVNPAWKPDWNVTGPYGEPAWIQAIASWRNIDPDWILPLPGTSMANFVALAVAAHRGDTVLIESPAYDPLLHAADFIGLHHLPIHRNEEKNYEFDLNEVKSRLAQGARTALVTNLHNPSGASLPPQQQKALIDLTAEYDATLIVDEVYLDYHVLNRGAPRHSAAGRAPHVLVTDSLTKVYGLGPLRAGWLIAHPDRIARARQVIDLLHVVNPPVSTRLAAMALASIEQLARRSRSIYSAAWPIYQAWLDSETKLVPSANHGALFGWARLPHGIPADQFCNLLFTRYETNVVPGSFFECPNHIRIGLGLPAETLTEGLRHIGTALDEIRQP
jgi:hypothetical protein